MYVYLHVLNDWLNYIRNSLYIQCPVGYYNNGYYNNGFLLKTRLRA